MKQFCTSTSFWVFDVIYLAQSLILAFWTGKELVLNRPNPAHSFLKQIEQVN